MNIKIVNYTPSGSPLVQAFVDIEIDGWLRFNGLNFHRDGQLRPAQLTRWRQGNPGNHKIYRDAVQILDADLANLLAADIVAAINQHIALLPEDRRARPPVASKPRSKPNQLSATQGVMAMKAPLPKPSSSPAPTRTVPQKLTPLPPPQRLMLPPRRLAGVTK